MSCLFSWLHRSSHLQLTFPHRFLHTVGDAQTHLFPPSPEGKAVTRVIPQQKTLTGIPREPRLRGHTHADKERERGRGRAGDVLAGDNLSFPNILQWFRLHHTGRPHSSPPLHTKRAVCMHPHFHTTSGHCCNASQIRSLAPVKHILFFLIGNYVKPCKKASPQSVLFKAINGGC